MRALQLVGVATLLLIGDVSAQRADCLHGSSENAGNRARREQALQVAREINKAQAAARGIGPRPLPYQPLERLINIPPTPTGFRLQYRTDGASYWLSIKDTLDPCRYAVFSDDSGDVYQGIPSNPAPDIRIQPLTRGE